MRTPDQLTNLAESLHKPREEYLQWKCICERYKRGDKSAFAKIIMRMAGSSMEERKQKALASEEYQSYLRQQDKAEREKIKAQIIYDNMVNDYEALLSALSYDKVHMGQLGG